MKRQPLKPMFFVGILLLTVSLACTIVLGNSTPTPIPPTFTAVPLQPTIQLIPPTADLSQPTAELLQPTAAPLPTEVVTSQFFTEEWDNGFGAWVQQVELNSSNGDKSQAKLSVEDGHLSFDLGRELLAYVFFPSFSYTDVRIDVKVNNRGTNVNNVLLVCRKSEEGHYLVNIANSGLYSMYAYNGLRNSYTRIADGGSNNIVQGKEINNYSLVCLGKTLTLYINGIQTRTFNNDQFFFPEGQVGVGVASEEQLPVKVWFENVTISAP